MSLPLLAGLGLGTLSRDTHNRAVLSSSKSVRCEVLHCSAPFAPSIILVSFVFVSS